MWYLIIFRAICFYKQAFYVIKKKRVTCSYFVLLYETM